MENALKVCSSIQRLLVLVSGILLVFMLSVDDKVSYQNALSDILVLGPNGANDLSNFITSEWIVKRRSDDEILPIYRASNETLKRFALILRQSMSDLGVRIEENEVFNNTIFTNGEMVRLRGLGATEPLPSFTAGTESYGATNAPLSRKGGIERNNTCVALIRDLAFSTHQACGRVKIDKHSGHEIG